MKKTLTIIAINVAVFCTLVVGIELLSQLIYRTKTGHFLYVNNAKANENERIARKLFERHPYLGGRLRASVSVLKDGKKITTTPYHTRWTGAAQEDTALIRIAILGGSTTFGTGVTDEDSWPARLQENLGKDYSVINYGVPGYATAEAIIQMAPIVPEAKPHIVIFYEGWNDIRNYHEKDLGADYYGHGTRQLEHLGILSSQNTNSNWATVWMARKIRMKLIPPKKHPVDFFTEPDTFVDAVYVRNLNTLKLLTQNIPAWGVFIPQILNYANYHGKETSRRWTRHIQDDAMPTLMDHFNA